MEKLFVFLILLGFIYTLQAQEVVLDLQKCRKMAVENSKKLKSAEQQREKARFEQNAYRANFFPKFSGMGMYAYMQKKLAYKLEGGYLPVFKPDGNGTLQPDLLINPETHLPVIGPDGNPIFNSYAFMPDIQLELGLRNVYSVGVTLEQPVYMGGKIRSAFGMASLGREMADLNVQLGRSEILAEADEVYWQYVRVREQMRAAEKYVEVVSELVRNVKDAVQSGMASQNDLLKAQVKQNEAELLYSKAKNGLTLSSMNLCRLVGLDLHSILEVKDTLNGDVQSGILIDNEDISVRPEYGLLERQVELKAKEVALTRSDFLPQLGIVATYGYGDGVTLNGNSDGIASFAAMASLKIPIYHWGEGRNKVKAIRAEQEIATLQQEEMMQMMQLEIAKARYGIEDAMARVRLTQKSLDQATENMKDSQNRYEVGMETITNYMEAQAQWQNAWSNAIDARAELRLSETFYLKVTGRLTMD